jgi:hypothetical protein
VNPFTSTLIVFDVVVLVRRDLILLLLVYFRLILCSDLFSDARRLRRDMPLARTVLSRLDFMMLAVVVVVGGGDESS